MASNEPELSCAHKSRAAVWENVWNVTDNTPERETWQATQRLETVQQTGSC